MNIWNWLDDNNNSKRKTNAESNVLVCAVRSMFRVWINDSITVQVGKSRSREIEPDEEHEYEGDYNAAVEQPAVLARAPLDEPEHRVAHAERRARPEQTIARWAQPLALLAQRAEHTGGERELVVERTE